MFLLGACTTQSTRPDTTGSATAPACRSNYNDGDAERLAAALQVRLGGTSVGPLGFWDARAAIVAFNPCLLVAPVPGFGVGQSSAHEDTALTVRQGGGYLNGESTSPAVVVYRYRGTWRSAALAGTAESVGGTFPSRSYPEFVVGVGISGIELITRGWILSAGNGEARLELFRLTDRAVALWRSPARYDCDYRARTLSPQFLLESWVDGDPNGRWPNVVPGCPPGTRREQLWERRGDVFVATATRIVPSPRDVLEQMFSSLRRSDRAAALRYATDATVVDRAVAVVTDPRFAVPQSEEEARDAAAAEELFWDALPAAFLGPAPPAMVSLQVGPYKLTVVRRAAGWLVSDVARTN